MPLAGEVRGGDGRRETLHGADGDPDADVAEASPQHRGAVRRAREPHRNESSRRAVGTRAPRNRLTERPRPDPVAPEAAIPLAVR